MGILARFRDVMRANIGSLLERAEDPEKTIDEYMRQMHRDLGQVKAETAAVQAEESRAKRALDECGAEVRKLQRYAEKAVESGDEERARKFLERKAQQAERLGELQAAYEQISANAAQMKQMQDKLVSDLSELEARHTSLKAKLAQAGRLQQTHASASAGGVEAAFRAAEEQADRALNEAEALAELRDGARKDDLDELIAQLEKGKDDNAGD
ncbi:PspA/IM30 family protein [Paenibacillus sp. TH7-28]